VQRFVIHLFICVPQPRHLLAVVWSDSQEAGTAAT
jgi:hypothetical protein